MDESVVLHCGLAKLRAEVTASLEILGASVTSESDNHLILDAPLGWALWKCEELTGKRVFIVTDNPCPEYKLDLLSKGPSALMSNVSVADIYQVLGKAINPYPTLRTPLSRCERLTLHLVATDHSNCDIARIRAVEEQTVKNTVLTIYHKLYFNSRLQAAYYYFGKWHLLHQKGWTPPPHVAPLAA